MSLATQVLIGVGLGIVSGIFFGEKMAFLKMFGDAFIQLLQMTVLPYVVISLIVGLGGLSYRQAAASARNCGLVLALLWAIGLLVVLLMPLSFPQLAVRLLLQSESDSADAAVQFPITLYPGESILFAIEQHRSGGRCLQCLPWVWR